MKSDEMIRLCKRHSLYTWAAQKNVSPLPVAKAQGVFFWTPEGKRYIDFNSQLMCVNIGHAHPKVIAAMKRALDDVVFVYPQTATEARARLSEKLAKILPGTLKTFYYTMGGAEANENAIKIVRDVTGRQKILSRYRSYHGATNATLQLTGDPRRWASEPGMPGVIRVMDPRPYEFSFGKTEEEMTAGNLRYLEEIIQYEGPKTIAAMFIESVTGTNGILKPPKGYLKGLKELLGRHGILLVCDEVMCGFGRTGRMFGFEHGDIVPDVVTMAKGLTSAYFPLGAVALRDDLAAHYEDKVFYGGATYNSHPLGLATALAVLEVLEEERLVENAARLEKVVRAEMDRLQAKHPSMKEGRCIGLFGMIDLQKNARGEPLAPFNGTSPAMARLAKHFDESGLFTFVRWGSFMCNPPLCITEEQLREAFSIIDRGLDLTDEAFERA